MPNNFIFIVKKNDLICYAFRISYKYYIIQYKTLKGNNNWYTIRQDKLIKHFRYGKYKIQEVIQ